MDIGSDKANISSSGYSDFSVDRNKYSVYAGAMGNIGAHSLQTNIRYDYVEDVDSDLTGYLGYGYDLTSNWKLLASVSTSFLAPTLDQLYNPMYGNNNEDLKSERSTNYEAGIQYAKGKDLVRLSVFEWHTRDLINTVKTGPYTSVYQNVGKAKNTGVELNAQTEIFGFDFTSNLTWHNRKIVKKMFINVIVQNSSCLECF